MKWANLVGALALGLLAAIILIAGGYAGEATNASNKDANEGWWCQEHGVPEEMCSLCLPEAEVKKRFKDTGDWCKTHERAKSQCFKCDPKLYAKFEALYEAKYGKKPPRPPESEFKK